MNSGLNVRLAGATPNGGAMAAIVAAGAGACAMGVAVVLHETGIFSAPTLYPPVGGVSGRTSLAVAVWLMAWVVLHHRWSRRQIPPRRPWFVTLTLTAVGVLGTFPPLWKIL